MDDIKTKKKEIKQRIGVLNKMAKDRQKCLHIYPIELAEIESEIYHLQIRLYKIENDFIDIDEESY